MKGIVTRYWGEAKGAEPQQDPLLTQGTWGLTSVASLIFFFPLSFDIFVNNFKTKISITLFRLLGHCFISKM